MPSAWPRELCHLERRLAPFLVRNEVRRPIQSLNTYLRAACTGIDMACSVFRLAPRSRTALAREDPSASTLDGRSKEETYLDVEKMLFKFLAKYPVDTCGRMVRAPLPARR